MSNSVQPHRRQPTRLPHPWDSTGKNTEMGCHFLLQCMKVKSQSKSLSCVRHKLGLNKLLFSWLPKLLCFQIFHLGKCCQTVKLHQMSSLCSTPYIPSLHHVHFIFKRALESIASSPFCLHFPSNTEPWNLG